MSKIKNTGDLSQAAINSGTGDITQQIIINYNYGLPLETSYQETHPRAHDPENRVRVRLSDLVGPITPIIEGRKFTGVDILGPCVIYMLDGTHIDNCNWSGITQALFIEVPDEWSGVSGVIGLKKLLLREL